MLRDFTDLQKDKLLQFVDADQQKNDGRGIFGGAIDFFADGINYNGLDIANYVGNIDAYHQKLIDKNDMTRNDIITLFEEVHNVDTGYKSKLADKLKLLVGYNTTLTSMNDVISVNISNVEISNILLSPTEFSENINSVDQSLVDYYIDQFVIDNGDGTFQYKWAEIDAVLNKAPEDITQMEYYILANLYISMDMGDAELFLSYLADKVEDVDIPWYQQIFQQHQPSNYTVWEYNQEKLAGLQHYINYQANVYSQCMYLVENCTEEELRELYPELTIDSSSNDYKHPLYTAFDEERRAIIQRQALLSTCGILSTSSFATDSDVNFAYWFSENGELTGAADAIGPQISVSTDENGNLNLTFCNTKNTIYNNVGMEDATSSVEIVNHLNENTISVGNVLSGNSLTNSVNENAYAYYSAEFAYSFCETLPEDAAKTTFNVFRDNAVQDGIKEVFKSIGKESLGGTVSSVAGPVIGFSIDFVLGEMERQEEAQKHLADATNTYTAIDTSIYCDSFEMDGVIVSTDGSDQIVLVYPTTSTLTQLDNLNMFIEDENIDLSQYDLSYPITMDDINNKQDNINDFIYNGISESDRYYIFEVKE